MFDVIGIGDPVIDTHVQIASSTKEVALNEINGRQMLGFEFGAKIPIVDSFQSLGGNATNTSVALSKLGLSCAFLSTVGDDTNGQTVLRHFKNHKVDTSLITQQAGADTRYSVVLNYQAERTILSYSEKKSYIWPEPIPNTTWIFYGGLVAGFETIQTHLVEFLNNHPTVKLAVNPGSYMMKYAMQDMRALVSRADIVFVNVEEAEKLTDTTLAAEKSVTSLGLKLLAMGAKEVVITDGGEGAYAGSGTQFWHLPTYPVKVVAKTGAGDSFSAGYLAARHAGHDIPSALRWGSANSASVISADGPHAGLLKKNDLEKFIQKFPEVEPAAISV